MPQTISAQVLKTLKKQAEEFIGHPVTDAVITVPAYFNDGQRQATKRAGALAGLNVRRIVNEPTAAALAYGINDDPSQTKRIAVFDLGGGTFDISILEVGGGVWAVKSTNGDTFLGGDDFDREIVNLLARHYLNQDNGADLRDHPSAMQKLNDAAEKAKVALSNNLETTIDINFMSEGLGDHPNLTFTIDRAKFESLIEKYLLRIETCCKQALKDANFSISEITNVVLVGGSTRVPAVANLTKRIFGKEPDTSVNPDEVVALGAAIQGAILAGEQKNMILVDVTPLSLGIEVEHELMDVLIPRNTPIPCIRKEIYTTTEDEQDEVDVFVYQGESRRITRNRLLGQFVLDGIEESEAGDPQIETTLKIDADGILQVSAKNLVTGSEQHITIKGSSSVSDDDLKTIQNAAEQDQYEDFSAYDDEDDDDDDELDGEDLLELAESLLEDTDSGLSEVENSLDTSMVDKIKKHKEELAEALDMGEMNTIDECVTKLLLLWEEVESTLEQ